MHSYTSLYAKEGTKLIMIPAMNVYIIINLYFFFVSVSKDIQI
jgi:hypothetical protein